MKNQRIFIAYTISPTTPAIIYYISTLLDINTPSKGLINLFICMLIITFSYLGCLIFTPLTLLFLRKINFLCTPYVVIFGAIWGTFEFYATSFLIAFMIGSRRNIVPELNDFTWGTIFGLAVSLPFCLIAGFPMTIKKSTTTI